MWIYFGHPISVYDTPKEQELMWAIRDQLPQYRIENPNQAQHEQGYQRYKEEQGSGMDYYYTEVLPRMDAGIFLPFEDGLFGAGVFKEADWLRKKGKVIWEIDMDCEIKPFTLDEARKLSVDETRRRVRISE